MTISAARNRGPEYPARRAASKRLFVLVAGLFILMAV